MQKALIYTKAILAMSTLVCFNVLANDGPVLGYTNDTCSSSNSVLFLSLPALIGYDGTEDSNGYTWNFGSYKFVLDDENTCHELDYEEIIVIGTPNPPTGDGNNGVGSTAGGGSPRGSNQGSTPHGPANPEDLFDEKKNKDLLDCWEDKLDELEDVDGWISESTGETWIVTEGGEGSGKGKTDYIEETKTDEKDDDDEKECRVNFKVEIYKNKIAALADHRFDVIALYTQIHEKAHVLQGIQEKDDEDGICTPSPYEYYDMEINAYKTANTWWWKLYETGPPWATHSSKVADKPKRWGEFKRKKKQYQEFEEKEASGTLNKDEKEKMDDLKEWFLDEENLPGLPGESGSYNKNMDLECDNEEDGEKDQ